MAEHSPTELARLATDVQTLWTMCCAALVLFMQAGFCCIEAGAVRHKNSINVAIKNVVDLCISFPAFFVVGYALMFGADRYGLVGEPTLFLAGVGPDEMGAFVYQAAFCSTAATIVSGGVAERCRFLPYVFISAITAVIIYPLFGHAVWGDGALAQLGFHDFAGSSVVHTVGAGITLAGVQILGPRRDRFDGQGGVRTVPASSMPMIALGVVILTFGWIGFNGGSAPLGSHTATIIANTLLAACFGGLGALLFAWALRGHAVVELILNGVLGGLVAITACADVVSLQAAALVGIAGGMAVVVGTAVLDWLRLDDAVGAIPVHGVAGMVGVVLTAAFVDQAFLQEAGMTRTRFLTVQAIGASASLVWSYSVGFLAWTLVARFTSLRVGPVEESVGMNFSEHKVDSALQALARGVVEARAGHGQALEHGHDAVPDGQLAGLSVLVRELVQDRETSQRLAAQWSRDLDSISGTLDLSHRIGREALETYQDEVANVDRTLGHISGLLEEKPVDWRSLSVAHDSIVNLRRRIDLLRHKLPSGLDSWEEINRTAQRLDLLIGNMRGDMRGSH